ncbi:hypothetical protein ACFX13_019716 [Malus domestica]
MHHELHSFVFSSTVTSSSKLSTNFTCNGNVVVQVVVLQCIIWYILPNNTVEQQVEREKRLSWHQQRRGWRGVQEETQALRGSVSYLCDIQPNPSSPTELHIRDVGRWCQLCRRAV